MTSMGKWLIRRKGNRTLLFKFFGKGSHRSKLRIDLGSGSSTLEHRRNILLGLRT